MKNIDLVKQFLLMFGNVSSILRIEKDNPEYIYDIDDTLDHLHKPDNIFIRIVISIKMNSKDIGLLYLERMSQMAKDGVSMDDIYNTFPRNQRAEVWGLCADVLSGVKYTLRHREVTDIPSVLVTEAFIKFLRP